MKNGKSNFGFSFAENIANFEAFRWNISLSANLFFLKSGPTFSIYFFRHPTLLWVLMVIFRLPIWLAASMRSYRPFLRCFNFTDIFTSFSKKDFPTLIPVFIALLWVILFLIAIFYCQLSYKFVHTFLMKH